MTTPDHPAPSAILSGEEWEAQLAGSQLNGDVRDWSEDQRIDCCIRLRAHDAALRALLARCLRDMTDYGPEEYDRAALLSDLRAALGRNDG